MTLNITDLRPPDEQRLSGEQMREAWEKGVLFETVHRRKDGTLFPVEVSSRGVQIGGDRVLLSIVRDITERKRAEEERKDLMRMVSTTRVAHGHVGAAELLSGCWREAARRKREASMPSWWSLG